MEFRILGPLEACVGGQPVYLPGARQRALLTLLLLHPNQALPAERLIEDLWHGEPPREAMKSLQMHVGRLRRALGEPGRSAVETVSGGYRLLVSHDALDLSRFERRAERGRRLAVDGSFADAADEFAAALGEWRGRALEDVAYEPFAQAEIGRLEELRVSTYEEYIDAELAQGRHEERIARLQTLVSEHPFRERLCGQLMLALYRAGRQVEALEAFQRTRKRLSEELGLEVGRRLYELQAAVLAHDPGLDWRPRGTQSPARELPRRLRDDAAFIGRQAECERLGAAWEDVCAGSRRLVLVAGEPGIGKTRLAKRIAERAHGEGGTVLHGRCEEHLAVPYRPWIDIVSQCIDRAPDAFIDAHVADFGEVARLTPALARRVQLPEHRSSRPEIEQYLLFEAVTGLLRAAAGERPLLMFLDDLHWADRPSLALLRHVLANADDLRALVLCTYRDSELSSDGALSETLAALRRLDGVERIALAGLEPSDVVALVRLRSGHELTAEGVALAHRLARETSGNPFFLGEMLSHHAESGGLRLEATGWQLAGEHWRPPVPESLRQVIMHRVNRLGATAAELLRTAAVIGGEFELEPLAAAVRRDPDDVLDPLDAARRARIVREEEEIPGRYRFEHALVSQTLVDDLGPTRRARMHARVAEVLSARPGTRPAELAHHWTRAGAHADAIRESRGAGREALDALAPGAATRWFGDALHLHRRRAATDPAVECDILTELGEAQRRAGDAAYRETLLEAARIAGELEDGERLATAALANTRGFESVSGEVDQERVLVLRAALELSADAPPLRRARLLALLALELTFAAPIEERRRLSDEAVRLAADDPETLASILWARHAVLWTPELLDEHLENAARLRRLAGQLEDPLVSFCAACDTALTSVWCADIAAVDAALGEMALVSERVGKRHPILSWIVTWYSAWRAQLAGRLDEAETLARRAAELGRGQPDAGTFLADQLAAIRWDQGRLSEQRAMLEQAVSRSPRMPLFKAWLALAYCDLGRSDDAWHLIEPSVAMEFTDVPRDILWLSTLCLYAEVCARLPAPEPSAVLYETLLPFADQVAFNASTVLGSVHWFLTRLASTLGESDRAGAHAAAAAAVHERLAAPLAVRGPRAELLAS